MQCLRYGDPFLGKVKTTHREHTCRLQTVIGIWVGEGEMDWVGWDFV